jgi:hypothetical protein
MLPSSFCSTRCRPSQLVRVFSFFFFLFLAYKPISRLQHDDSVSLARPPCPVGPRPCLSMLPHHSPLDKRAVQVVCEVLEEPDDKGIVQVPMRACGYGCDCDCECRRASASAGSCCYQGPGRRRRAGVAHVSVSVIGTGCRWRGVGVRACECGACAPHCAGVRVWCMRVSASASAGMQV